MPYNSRFTGPQIDSSIEKASKLIDAGSDSVPVYFINGVPTACTSLNLPSSSSTASILQTPRNINGTSFDGSQDITTNLWGEGRTFSIIDADNVHSGQAVLINGGQNYSLHLPAIIKAALNGNADSATSADMALHDSLGRVISDSYLPLAGGIMTGTIYFGTLDSYITATDYTGKAATADRATSDIAGNQINLSYLQLAGGTMTGNIYFGNTTNYINQTTYTGCANTALNATNDENGLNIASSYLKLAGGTMTGALHSNNIIVEGDSTITFKSTNNTANGHIYFTTSTNSQAGELALAADGVFKIRYGAADTYKTLIHSENIYNYTPTMTGTGATGLWAIDITGNSNTTTKLATARLITIDGAVNGSALFDGTSNIQLTTTVNHTHSYAGSATVGGPANSVAHPLTIKVNGNTISTFDGSNTIDCNLLPSHFGLAQALKFIGETETSMYAGLLNNGVHINGIYTTATTGDVVLYHDEEYVWLGTYWELLGRNSSFALSTMEITAGHELTGGGNLQNNITIDHAESIVTPGDYGDTVNQEPQSGETFLVPTITVNKYGHVTNLSTHTIEIPDNVPKLTNTRLINGTNFDGTSDITTRQWGESREFTISDANGVNTSVVTAVNGSVNIDLKLPGTIEAEINGNAATASVLKTPRRINGTSFNGSAEITTQYWGTSRQFKISDATQQHDGTVVNVNGESNVTLKLPTIIQSEEFIGKLTGNADSATIVKTELDGVSGRMHVVAVDSENMPLKYCNDVYIDMEHGILYGSAYNDYAEFREGNDEAGRVVCETGKGDLVRSTERLQPGARVVSDTYGFIIGETEKSKLPIAISGRVLVYPYENREEFAAGDPVCAGPDGTVSKMSREEVREYPDRMIGTVSEIPDYEEWNKGIKVNGRIWIYIR